MNGDFAAIVIKIIFALLSVTITYFIIPFLTEITEKYRTEKIDSFIQDSVIAAEQVIKGDKKGAEKKVLDGQNNDISESHISIVRKSEVNENDENETDFLVGNKNNGEVKEEVELSKDNKTDSGEGSGDEEKSILDCQSSSR